MSKVPRKKLPDERRSVVHRFEIEGGHKGFIVVGLYEDGSPGEIFIHMSKGGSTLSGLLDTIAVSISVMMQHGIPLASLVRKFVHTKFEPFGSTNNPDIPDTSSITDYLFRWLGKKFLTPDEVAELSL